MISAISLHNFKAFDQMYMRLTPLTFLLGPNNSGKSSIIAAIRLLAQTSISSDPQVPLLLDGIMGDFGTYKDVVYRNFRGRPMKIAVSIPSSPFDFDEEEEELIWKNDHGRIYTIRCEYKYNSTRKELILKNTNLTVDGRIMLTTKYSNDSDKHNIESVGGTIVPSNIKASISRMFRMVHFMLYGRLFRLERIKGISLRQFTGKVIKQVDTINDIMKKISSTFERVEYIGPMRIPPERTYLYSGEKRGRIGMVGENAAGILAIDAAVRGSVRSHNLIDRVSKWLAKAGIGSELKLSELSDRHFEIRIQHPITKEYENLADVGQGNSQILPVLVGGYRLGEGAIYMVEQPEIHLHPFAQAELADFFVDLYQMGIQCIVETHSEHLILRLLQHIAGKRIPHNHVSFYYVYPKRDKKQVKLLTVDQKGFFQEEWPEGFFPERLNEATNLARLRRGS